MHHGQKEVNTAGIVFVVFSAALFICMPHCHAGELAGKLMEKVNQIFYQPVFDLWKDTVLTPAFFIVLGVTLILERFFPAKPDQRIFSVSFAQDFVWFFYESILHTLIIVTYISWIQGVYYQHFSWMSLEGTKTLPGWFRFLLGMFLLDFLYWLQHVINHKVPWFWQMHAVHHSQKELNFFTDFRYHVLEYVVRESILVVPFLILEVGAPQIALFAFFRRWYTRFYHANIKTDLGPLRYILVTPQSHRVHHSCEKRHQDMNFGSLFSIWDFMFGTQFRGFDEYPETGIGDKDFPLEKSRNVFQLLLNPLNQLLYPFFSIGKQISRKIRKGPL